MIEKIKELKEKQEVCNIYHDENDTLRFSVGFILGYDEKFFVIESIDPNGKSDGFKCGLMDSIIKIESSTNYTNNIGKLFKFYEQNRNNLIVNEDMVLDLLNFAKQNNKICSIILCESNNDDIVGFVESVENDLLNIRQINENGENDGSAFLDLGRISGIRCGSGEEIKLEILYKLNV